MEPKLGKESVVSRLFGFGRKKKENGEDTPTEETGFAIADDIREHADEQVTIPEQVIRIRTNKKDDAVQAIGESFTELTRMLGSVSDRLDRQGSRSIDLSDQLKDLPEYLRALPRLQQDQNDALRTIGERMAEGSEALARLPAVQEEQTRAVHALTDRVFEGTDAIARLPDRLAAHADAQKDAIEKVASSQQQMAKVVYASNKKSLELFQQATQKTLLQVQKQQRIQKQQMEQMLYASTINMRRTFFLAAAFMAAALVGVVGLLFFR